MATTDRVLRQRVERGAALLDAEQPGWAPRIDVPTLNISAGAHCVLGQLYPRSNSGTGYGTGLDRLHIPSDGFTLGFIGNNMLEDDRLLPLWREAIEARCGGSER